MKREPPEAGPARERRNRVGNQPPSQSVSRGRGTVRDRSDRVIANPAHTEARRRPGYHSLLAALFVLFVILAMADAGLIGARALLRDAERRYEGRIYPRVYVLGVPIGRLTTAEAIAVLEGAIALDRTAVVNLRYDGGHQAIPWFEAGIRVDARATAYKAYEVGRSEASQLARLSALLRPQDVAPVLAIDEPTARSALERVAAEVAVPPTEATLRLEGGELVPVPGQPGRMLDVEAALSSLRSTVAAGQTDIALEAAFLPSPPRVADASPLLAQARELLKRQIELSAYDVLSDQTFVWTLGRQEIATWLRVQPSDDEGTLTVRPDPLAVQTTLTGLAATMGEGRGFRIEEAASQVVQALQGGGGSVALYLTHPERTYVVQPGDVFDSIAVRFGIPPAVLAEANPGIDPGLLVPGQVLTIPSPDVLIPYLPVRNKRIVISIPKQRMRVFENGALLWDWPVSTGIPSSPTLPGTFQVLDKIDNAYASRWHLWMPHFLAVYRAGPDFYNGIHALPISEGGGRLWAGLLGRPASFGCIILGVHEAETLYQWAEVGVPVIIEG